MSIENLGLPREPDQRFRKIMEHFDPSMEEEFLLQWTDYSEEEKGKFYNNIMTDRT